MKNQYRNIFKTNDNNAGQNKKNFLHYRSHHIKSWPFRREEIQVAEVQYISTILMSGSEGNSVNVC